MYCQKWGKDSGRTNIYPLIQPMCIVAMLVPRYRRVSHPRAEIEAHAEQHQQDLKRSTQQEK